MGDFTQDSLAVDLGEVGPVKLPESRSITLVDAAYYGMRISHSTFGEGVVIGVDEEFTVIRFEDKKRSILSTSPSIALPA